MFAFFKTGNVLAKYFIILLVAFIAVIILPNISQIYNKLGFDTVANMKEQVTEIKVQRDIAVKTNDDNVKTIDKIEKVSFSEIEVIIKARDNETKVNNVTKQIKINKDKKINSIIAKDQTVVDEPVEIAPKLKIAMELSGESLEKVEASQANIVGIWQSYCQDTEDNSCKNLTDS